MNRKILPAQRKLTQMLRTHTEWGLLPTAFLATLLALPVNAAVKIPADPLASGVLVAPNILFILDDSGSMQWENINNGSIASITGSGNFSDGPSKDGVKKGNTGDISTSTGNSWVYEQNYITNTLFYNPTVNYAAWMGADGNRLAGGTSYSDAYSDSNYVDYTGVEANTSSSHINLSSVGRTYYAPKNTANTDVTYLSNIGNYYRYQIPIGGADVVRGEYGQVVANVTTLAGFPKTSVGIAKGNWVYYPITLPAGTSSFTVKTSGGSGDADLYVRKDGNPTTGTYDCKSIASGNNESCPISDSGGYYVGVYAYAAVVNLTVTVAYTTTNSCDGDSNGSWGWINCTSATPTGRSVANEKTNFATWYSYYRTRIKSAKGGGAEAFNSMGNKVRVGFRSLHENGSNNFNIPVNDGNDGRFVNNDGTNGNSTTSSRSKWFNRLFRASAGGDTPLQSVLDSAGLYFSSTAYTGPYGPESGTAQLSCRQNFAILTTDGYWNSSTVSTGTSGDDNNGKIITNGLPVADVNYKSYQYVKQKPYSDSVDSTLADVAMKYWKTDLRTDLDNNVPSDYSKVAGENDLVGRDPAFWQHMVTFTISIGLKTVNGLTSVSQVNAGTVWPTSSQLDTGDPTNDNKYRLDDLLHAAVNGRGSFVSASSPQAFADGLAAALAKINERTASFSNMGASDSTQMNNGTLIFTASYVSGKWSGLLRAEKATDGSAVWKTTDSGKFAAYSSRNVFTRDGTLTGGVGAGGAGAGTTFPTANQLTALVRSGGPANYEVSGSENAEYIKGNQAKEGSSAGKLRVRNTVMGDIVNSSPAYVADSNTVFVGANDGMLHAFDGSTGVEQFAYIPGIINFGNLADLSRGDYEHRWFVDGPIAISPKQLSPDGTKNILVGTLGRGGKGVYALDVTAPASFTSSNVKWEVNSTNATPANDNMGMVLGAPVLAKVRNGGTMPSPTLTSAVLLGNGINSGSDKAALLVLNMDTGAVIKEVATDNTTGNGLFAPTGIYAADGKTLVYAYAGDLQGNVWKFDLTSTSPSSWTSKKIFHAEKTAGTPQAITGGIASAIDPRTNKRWIFFGTGSYLTTADGNDSSTSSQSMYGVIDDAASAYTRSDLAARTVTDGTGADVGERYFQDMTGAMLAGKHGWYVDLTGKGERIVQNTQMDGSYMVTASMMPSGNSCADASGSGYINAITPFPDMVASGKSYFDRDGTGSDNTGTNGKPTGSVKTNGMPTLPLLLPGQVRSQTSSGTGTSFNKGQPQWNRVSWRELRND